MINMRHDHREDEQANHRPAAGSDALDQRRADARPPTMPSVVASPMLISKAMDHSGDDIRRELGDDAVADLLEGGAARRVQRFQNARIQIGVAVLYILEIMPMEQMLCVITPQNAPGPVTRIQIQRPDDGGQRADQQNQRVEDEATVWA